MATPQVTALTPRCAEAALPGTWKLAPGRAITLEPREAGIFKVSHGQMWATFEGPHRGRREDSGDLVLGTGQTLRLQPGQRMVIEVWGSECPAYFSWDPLPVLVRRLQWADIVQPVADLRLAFVFGAHAVTRLVMGLAHLAWQTVAGPRVAAADATCGV